MKNKLFCFVFLWLLISCNRSFKNDFYKAEQKIPFVKVINSIHLALIDSISTFKYKDKEYDIAPLCATINYRENKFIYIDRYLKSIISFELDDFSNNQKCISFINKNNGKGPNEFIYPNDIIYNKEKNIYYVSDLLNYKIYIYDSFFQEKDRIKLPFRPAKIVCSKKYLYITPYDLPYEDIPYRIDIKSKTKQKGIFHISNIGNNFEKLMRNKIYIAPFNNTENTFFVVKNYPNFNIYKIVNKKIIKIFCSPDLKGKKLPKPTLIYKNNDKKIWGLSAFADIIFDSNDKLLFTLTTVGWKELAQKLKIHRYILIFDDNGNTLCEYKISPYEGGENSICYDSKNKILYYISSHYIKKFRIIKERG